jgi:tetratricopeptide (TPR) repeat protein
MKRIILTGLLAFGAGMATLMAQAPAAAPKGPAPKSKSEMEALQALQAAQGDPDKTIAACENLITKFADTDFKAIALFMEADSYEKKKDYEHMVIFAERALEANPQNFQAVLMLAKYYSTNTRENDLDREEKLGKEEKYANQVIEMMKTAQKPNPAIPDDQWAEVKKDISAEAYNAMGLGNLTRKKYDAAAANFKQAVDANSRPEPAYMVRLASALQAGGKNDEAIVWCDKILGDANAHPQIKGLATNIRAAAVKAGGKTPGGAPAPAK